MATASSSPCGACKFLRRKCTSECVFAPYFPPDQPLKFSNAHRIFGASNIAKLLNDLPVHQRAAAVNSLAYEAQARMKDPVYGCVGAISYLKQHIELLEREIRVARAELARYVQQNNANPGSLQHDDRLGRINLQANSISDTPIMGGVDQYQVILNAAVAHNSSNERIEQAWLHQHPQALCEAEYLGNTGLEAPSLAQLPSVRTMMSAGGHFLQAPRPTHLDGRSASSGEGASNLSSLSSP
ncbi:hypothetical protein KP509_25G066000 [Ceratopteris richardii]|uniref:LOB domain-containing protein n=1 Tax=Ceratopteris richardii TaxID=49495 RepID=A0A8T2RU27_CERRI|nr:hypothetical protein KP509_25G066000 [Ceratopteris richardii]KAH7298944.1 hypothetical protein KP509_25G066000 [Ceratopteris richardii]